MGLRDKHSHIKSIHNIFKSNLKCLHRRSLYAVTDCWYTWVGMLKNMKQNVWMKNREKKRWWVWKKQQGAMKSSFKYKMETEAHVAQPFPAEVSLKEETVRLEIWCWHQVQVVIGLIQGMSKYQTNSVQQATSVL